MYNSEEFKKWGLAVLEEIGYYYSNLEKFPVKSQLNPGDIKSKLPGKAPVEGEDLQVLLNDFREIILPGISHWQSPSFFAYFPANSSLPSLMAEMLTAAIGAQCMKWETSPAAAELEERMMDWLKSLTGIPGSWEGVIQDSASSATLAAILSAREKYSGYRINEEGFRQEDFRVYCSEEAHSSIEKAVKIAGIGRRNLVKVPVDQSYKMIPGELDKLIRKDLHEGYTPLCVVAALGTTGSTAIDPLEEIVKICQQYDCWLHVDAAFAGSALLLPEFRWMIRGIEEADSFVFNPHKWLFTNFDCSAYFVKERQALTRTFEILPEYLRTATQGQVNDYCDWGVPLGRRFRALKLWFVLRYYGEAGLQAKLREHISHASWLEEQILQEPDFELLAPRSLNLVCFRFRPKAVIEDDKVNALNESILNSLNKSGKIYLSHTKLKGKYTLRMVVGQTEVERRHVQAAWELVKETARGVV